MKTLFLTLLFAALATRASAYPCSSTSSCFFPPGTCTYQGLEHTGFLNGWVMNRLELADPLECEPLPPIGGTTDQVYHVTCTVELADGATMHVLSGNVAMTVRIVGLGPYPYTREFSLEILALDLSALAGPSGIVLRKDPNLAAPGHLQQQEFSPNYFTVSHFDLPFELSLDGGQTWSKMESVYPTGLDESGPVPARAATWGGVKATYR